MSDLMLCEIKIIEDFIKSSDVVFDIGAYVGEWSGEVLKRYPNVKIHQFEPVEKSFTLLSQNYENQVNSGQVIQNNSLISNIEKTVPFYYYESLPVMSTMYRRPEEVEKHLYITPIVVEKHSITLDSYCLQKQIEHIDFIKIDVEGDEYNVLQGAENLLENNHINCIQFEYGGCYLDSGVTLKEVFEYLTNKKYKVFKFTILNPDRQADEGINFDINNLVEITSFSSELETYDYSNLLALSSCYLKSKEAPC